MDPRASSKTIKQEPRERQVQTPTSQGPAQPQASQRAPTVTWFPQSENFPQSLPATRSGYFYQYPAHSQHILPPIGQAMDYTVPLGFFPPEGNYIQQTSASLSSNPRSQSSSNAQLHPIQSTNSGLGLEGQQMAPPGRQPDWRMQLLSAAATGPVSQSPNRGALNAGQGNAPLPSVGWMGRVPPVGNWVFADPKEYHARGPQSEQSLSAEEMKNKRWHCIIHGHRFARLPRQMVEIKKKDQDGKTINRIGTKRRNCSGECQKSWPTDMLHVCVNRRCLRIACAECAHKWEKNRRLARSKGIGNFRRPREAARRGNVQQTLPEQGISSKQN